MMLWQFLCVLLLPLLLMAAGPAHADFYKYTDKNGSVCISNTLDTVPKQYRATMQIVRDETLEKKDPGVRRPSSPAAASDQSAQPQRALPALPSSGSQTSESRQNELQPNTSPPAATGAPAGQRWRLPLMYGGAIVVIFLVARKVMSSTSSPQLSRVIYLAFFLGVFTLGFKLYADNVVNGYFTAKTRIMAMFEKANRREAPHLPGLQEGSH